MAEYPKMLYRVDDAALAQRVVVDEIDEGVAAGDGWATFDKLGDLLDDNGCVKQASKGPKAKG